MTTEKRLIDANALIQNHGSDVTNFDNPYAVKISSIKNALTVDAVEVVHGSWELYPSSMHRRCSICKMEYDRPKFNVRANYCPNCGAKMDGGINK